MDNHLLDFWEGHLKRLTDSDLLDLNFLLIEELRSRLKAANAHGDKVRFKHGYKYEVFVNKRRGWTKVQAITKDLVKFVAIDQGTSMILNVSDYKLFREIGKMTAGELIEYGRHHDDRYL